MADFRSCDTVFSWQWKLPFAELILGKVKGRTLAPRWQCFSLRLQQDTNVLFP